MSQNQTPKSSGISKEFAFTNRKTIKDEMDSEMLQFILNAQKNLKTLLNTINLKDQDREEINKQLKKIQTLNRLNIPTQTGLQTYYSITDSVGGVTEKTCLIDQAFLRKQLTILSNVKNVEEFKKNKIQINAILKHPKAGKVEEVQREALALNIARVLNFKHVTESTMVYHDTGNGRYPCLLVPFGEMDLLTQSVENASSSKGRLKKDHFQSVEDFGKYSAFFMLCADPDFMGKSCQNKGLTPGIPKELYIFDQVFMSAQHLGLDRAFNIAPTNIYSDMPNFIARHFMGRNKTVINDSSFGEKIQSAIEILQKKDSIEAIFRAMYAVHRNQKDPHSTLLRQDTLNCFNNFNKRIRSIKKLFPSIKVNKKAVDILDLAQNPQEDSLKLLKKSMLITQLVNKTQLFDKYGKPYRAPFFSNPSTYVKSVAIEGDKVSISFSRTWGNPLSENKKALLQQYGFNVSEDGKSATISKAKLLELNENIYFKEQEDSIDLNYSYLNPQKIKLLGRNYKEDESNTLKVIKIIQKNLSPLETISRLRLLPFKNKGFAAHLEQCFWYENMKKIIKKAPSEDQKKELQKEFRRAKLNGELDKYVMRLPAEKTSKAYREALSLFKPQPPSSTDDNLSPPPPR